MPPKRKQPFLSAFQAGRKHPRLNPRFQKKDEKEVDFPTDLSDPSILPPQAIELVRKAVEQKIENGKKLVFRGLKKAKRFEMQKLVKRLRIAREKNEDASVKKLDLEFEVLKTEEIDLNSLASNHVLKTFTKYKPLSTSPLFPPWLVLGKELEAQLNDKEIAKRNIIARLYNSNAVKEAVATVVGNVKSVMGVSVGDIKGKRKVTEIETDVGSESEEGSWGAVETTRLVKMKIDNKSTAEGESESEDEEEEWRGILNPQESADTEIDLDAFAADFMDRVAGSSDEGEDQGPLQRGTDDEWSGEDDEDGDGEDDEEDLGESDEDLEERAQHAKPLTSKPKSESKPTLNPNNQEVTDLQVKKSEKLKHVDSARSTFLPTLMSGYISGSDSDIDADYYKDKNGKKKGPAQPKERKNRMGQQARRALWEKKFGKEANHVKKEDQEKGRKKIEQRIKKGKGGDGKKQGGATEKKRKPTEVEGPLHPSWEAARKAKEQQAKVQEAVKGKPMGKKIVFD